LGGLDDEELRATFNGGLGMVLVVPPEAAATVVGATHEHGIEAMVVGVVIDGAGVTSRYVEGALETVA
jgi:phosphoribosylaminoimidazole (AIR) synthetase